MTEKCDKKVCKKILENLNECLDVKYEDDCTDLMVKWYRSKCDMNYDRKHYRLDKKILTDILQELKL